MGRAAVYSGLCLGQHGGDCHLAIDAEIPATVMGTPFPGGDRDDTASAAAVYYPYRPAGQQPD